MKTIFLTFLSISMALGLFANPVTVSFESIDHRNLPVELRQEEEAEEAVQAKISTETASLFDSTYAIVLVGLIGVYILLLRKKESRGMNL